MATPTDTAPADRTLAQRLAEASLASHPYRLELRGSPRSLAWPDVCAHCGLPAGERIRVEKAFYPQVRRRHGHRAAAYRIVGADVPFCTRCAERHREMIVRTSLFARYRTFLLNPVHIATIGLTVLLVNIWPGVHGVPLGTPGGRVAWSLLAVVGAGLAWTLGIMWWTTRPDRMAPRTEITMACDFTRNVSFLFERERHIYALRNKAFADALAAANRDRVWGDADQQRTWRRSGVVSLAILAALGVARWLVWYYTGK